MSCEPKITADVADNEQQPKENTETLQESVPVDVTTESSATDTTECVNNKNPTETEQPEPSPIKPPEEGEDVPENFFDELMNEDFIDGLNVVDTWDEEEKNHDLRKKIQAKRNNRPSPHRQDKRRSPRRRSTEKKRRTHSNERRDPNKTNRDILRDKDKCAKDQKAKLISEKLRVVETGLVPPGMEMEVDFLQIKEKEVKDRRISPVRRSRPSPQRRPRHVIPRRRSRSRSPRWKSPSREQRLRERRRYERSSKSRSPRRRLRSKSPGSDVSERERWLRFRSKSPKNKDSKFRRRSRSKSPRLTSKKTKSFLEELNDKLSLQSEESKLFLKEISKKLNPDSTNYPPVPVPAPQNMGPPVMDYDQEFFIGQPECVGQQSFQPQLGFMPAQHMLPPHQYLMGQPIMPQPVPVPSFGMPMVPQNNVAPQQYYENEKEAYTNLFKEKKISLTDYLSVTAKFSDSSRPVNIQNKIKVISECQEAIKELLGDTKVTGHFTLRKQPNPLEDATEKCRSPLKKSPAVRFQFTHPGKLEKKQTMVSSLNKLLSKFGKDLIYDEPPKSEKPPTPEPPIVSVPDPKQKTSTRSISCQTEPMRCDECLIRKYKVSIESHTQTADTLSFDIACQANLDDSPTKSYLKNQSLAYLTPAQLLAQNKHESPPKELHHLSPDQKRARISQFDDIDTRFRPENERSRAPIYDRDRGGQGSVGRSSMDSVFALRPGSENFNSGRQPEVFGNMGRPIGFNRGEMEPFNNHGRMEPPGFGQGREPPFNGRPLEQMGPPFRGPGRQGFEPPPNINSFGRGRRF